MRLILTLAIVLLLGGSCWAATATFAWDAPAVGQPTTYLLARQPQGGAWTLTAILDVPTQQYTDPAPLRGRSCYRVSAAAGSLESPPSNTVCIRCSTKHCRR